MNEATPPLPPPRVRPRRRQELSALLRWIAGSTLRPAGSALAWEQWEGTGGAGHGAEQQSGSHGSSQHPRQATRSTPAAH